MPHMACQSWGTWVPKLDDSAVSTLFLSMYPSHYVCCPPCSSCIRVFRRGQNRKYWLEDIQFAWYYSRCPQSTVSRFETKERYQRLRSEVEVRFKLQTRKFNSCRVGIRSRNQYVLSWTGPCNTPGPCNTRLIQPITINFSHSFCYIYKLYTAIIFSVKFETLLNVSIEDIVNSRTHLVWISKILNFFALCLSISKTK